MRSLGLFAALWIFCHCVKETACALGWRDLGELLGNFAIEGELLELCKR